VDSRPPDETADAMVAAAAEVARVHFADADGWCAGCLAIWGRLAPHPCGQAAWAAAVYAAYADPPD